METMERLPDGRIKIHIACALQKGTKRRIFAKTDRASRAEAARKTPIVAALGRGWRARSLIRDGVYRGKIEISKALGVSRTHLSESLNLTYLSPVIVEKIMCGELPEATAERFGRLVMPLWYDQHKAFGIDQPTA